MKWIIYISFFVSFQLCAQSVIKPFVKIGGAYNRYIVYGPSMLQLNLAGGIHFNQHMSIQIGAERVKGTSVNWDLLILSISPHYRVFDSKHIFSPLIGIDLGTELITNATDRYIRDNYSFINYGAVNDGSFEDKRRYKRGLFFGKIKCLADFNIKDFNISVGPTFNVMYIQLERVKNYYENSIYVDQNYGVGAELSFMYTFPMKKRTAKKALD